MLIGAYGTFWERDQVSWGAQAWRLLGRRGINQGHIQIADFRRAHGVYILYSAIGAYYVGLATGTGGIGGRLNDHRQDQHGAGWTRFSWFSFDSPSTDEYPDGVLRIQEHKSVKAPSAVVIRDVEALMQVALQPFANKSATKFARARKWIQVASAVPQFRTFDDLKHRIGK